MYFSFTSQLLRIMCSVNTLCAVSCGSGSLIIDTLQAGDRYTQCSLMREGKQKRQDSSDDDDGGKESRSSDDEVPDVMAKGGMEEPPLVRSAVSC